MNDDPRLSELLLQWEEQCEQGRPVSPEELCRDCPQLLEELRRRVQALRAMNPLLDPPAPLTEQATIAPPVESDPSVTLMRDGPVAVVERRVELPSVPGYETIRVLGRGGMGVVYLARQVSLGRLVALKMLLGGAYTAAVQRQRFRAEAELVARLQHPNIVQVHEIGEHDGHPYFALEYVDGCNLAEALDGTPWPPRRAAELVAILAEAVRAAHERGVVHRDLKPANVLLAGGPGEGDLRGTVKITDFGLARQLEQDQRLTETGAVMGTPSYMAPEQAEGKKDVGPGADVYALGALLYEGLTGRPPFLGSTTLETLTQVLAQEPVPPRALQPAVPRDLETVCLKCLHKDPARRYPSAALLADELRRFLAGEPVRARPVGNVERLLRWCRKRPAVAALTAAVLLLLVAVAGVTSFAYVRTAAALAEEEWQRQEAERQRRLADERREEADAQREAAVRAQKQASDEARWARRLAYAGEMQVAGEKWEREDGNGRQVGQRLDGCEPAALGEDLREFTWRYLWGQLRAAPNILRDRDGAVRWGAWRSDGKLVTIDTRPTLRCWDPAGGKVLHKIALEQRAIQAVDLAANGSLAAVLAGGVVHLIDPVTGQKRQLKTPRRGGRLVRLSADGRRLLVYHEAGSVAWLWDTATLERLGTFRGLKTLSSVAALAPDGRSLATSSGLGRASALLLDLAKKTSHGPLPATLTLYSLAFSPDGKTLAGGNMMGQVFLWEVAPFAPKKAYGVHLAPVTCFAFSADGRSLASGSADGGVVLTDLESGKTTFRGKGHETAVRFVSFSPDGRKLASGSRGGTVRLWDLDRRPQGGRVLEPEGALGRAPHLAYSPDGQWLAATLGSRVRLWSTRTWQAAAAPALPGGRAGRLGRLAFTPDSKRLAVGHLDGTVDLCQVESGKHLGRFEDPSGLHPDVSLRAVTALAFSPDGALLATGHGHVNVYGADYPNQAVRVWDVRTRKLVRVLPHPNTINSLAFSTTGTLLVSGAGHQVQTWNVSDWRAGKGWPVPGLIYRMALSPRDERIAVGEMNGVLELWKVASGKPVPLHHDFTQRANDLTFTPDGRTLATTNYVSIPLLHASTGRHLLTLRGHRAMVIQLAVAPDGNTLASIDRRGCIRLWQAPSFAQIEALRRVRVDPDE